MRFDLARICVAKVVKANAIETCALRYSLPRPFEIGARPLRSMTRHDIGANSF
jgi:hypothetical protein